MFCEACAMCTGDTVDQSNCVQLPRDIMCLPIGSMLLRSKILWMKHVVFWREPDGVIPRATGDWLTGRWDSRKVLRHCHNTWKTSTYARRCWSSRFWHSDWKSGLFPDFYRKYSKVRTFPGPGGQQLKIRTFPGNKDPWEPWRITILSFPVQLFSGECHETSLTIVNIGSGNGLVPSGIKPVHDPRLTKFYDVICRQQATMS